MFLKGLIAVLLLTQVVLHAHPENGDSSLKTYILSFYPRTTTILTSISGQSFPTRADRIYTLVQFLKDNALLSQRSVTDFLQNSNYTAQDVTIIWATNQLIVRNTEPSFIQKLREDFPEIVDAFEDFQLPVIGEVVPDVGPVSAAGPAPSEDDKEEQWGVAQIQASEVWKKGNRGENVTVCTLGTGVRGTHEALKTNFFGSPYGWFDPVSSSPTPVDGYGVGTHTTGIAVGTARGIGVAPGSSWSACKACTDTGMCASSQLFECGQWILCPTDPNGDNPRCDLAPQVVNNNWGGGSGNNFFESMLRAWGTAGIIPIFPIGSSGPTCNTVGFPGDSDLAIGAGATTQENRVAPNSGVGPSISSSRVKPDIVAPGALVLSSYTLSDTDYSLMSGSSIGSAHVAGLVALLLHDQPNMTLEQVLQALAFGGEQTVPTNLNCGGLPEESLPNYHVGWGRINAAKSASHP